MGNINPVEVVLKFNQRINKHNLEGLAKLMTEDHVFVDTDNNRIEGKEQMTNCWREFFERFPDYCNHFLNIEQRDGKVFAIGYVSCSFETLKGKYIWTAKVENNKLSEWCVYSDTNENRIKLGLIANN